MGRIITYKNAGEKGTFSQIKLDNGERILISVITNRGVQLGVEIFKLGKGGLFPTGSVWKTHDLDQMTVLFAGFQQSRGNLLDAVVSKVIGCSSIDEVKMLLSSPADNEGE